MGYRRFEALIHEGSREALSAAVDLYRGPLIDDVSVSEEAWSEWLTAERGRLLELALGALTRLGEQELDAGGAEQALQAGRRAVALNNMREDAHRLILRALVATARKAEALKHYQDFAALLKARAECGARCGNPVARPRASHHRAIARQVRVGATRPTVGIVCHRGALGWIRAAATHDHGLRHRRVDGPFGTSRPRGHA
jgi:DNA-binding SARP family transcriptional activator